MKKSAMYAEAILAIADQYSAGHLSPEDFLAINSELNDQYSMYLSCEMRKEAELNA